MESYFSLGRTSKNISINWQFGNRDAVDMICKYIQNLSNNHTQSQSPISKIFIYTCQDKVEDVKDLQKKFKEDMVLLNPLSVISMIEEEKVNLYSTLSLAETGNAFGNIDV